MSIRVTPSDGTYDWEVKEDGRGRVSRHRKKSAAKRKAKRYAKKRGKSTVFIHRADGTVQGTEPAI